MKMITVLGLFLASFSSSLVFAFDGIPDGPNDSKITQIVGVNLVCRGQGDLYAIRTVEGDERVWKSDAGEMEGFELTIRKFERLNCLNSYKIDLELILAAQSIPIKLDVDSSNCSSGDSQITAKASISGVDFRLICTPENNFNAE